MRVVVLHNAVAADAPPDERDVLLQAREVAGALTALGHQPQVIGCTLDLADLRERLAAARSEVVFNLVEALGGSDRLMLLAPALLEADRLPYTGAPLTAMLLSTHKVLAKERLRQAGLPTPDWQSSSRPEAAANALPSLEPPCIIKTVWEHGSFALDDGAVVLEGDAPEVLVQLAQRQRRLERECFAERYIPGREFNLSVLGGASGPEVLPPAEIDFTAWPADRPAIVGYDAKWTEDSAAWRATPRTFDFPAADRPLLDELRGLAEDCWRLFGLRGYARVDFRVDVRGRPWILEINANPCLSPDAGFAAALARAGISFPAAVDRILADALLTGCWDPASA